MNSRTHLSASAVLAALLCASAAQADVTAEEVWQEWQDYYASTGQTIAAGSEARDGDTLVLTDVKMTQEQDEARTEATVAEVRLKDLGDGTVEVTLSNDIAMKVNSTAEGAATEMTMNMSHSDLRLVVSGTPDALDTDMTATELRLAMDEIKVDDTTPPFKMEATISKTSGKSHMERAEGRVVTSDFNAESATFVATGADPEGTGTFNMSGTMNGLAGTGTATFPDGIDLKDMNAAVQAGFAVDGGFTYSDGAFTVDGTGADGDVAVKSEGGAGKLNIKMGKDGLAYGGEAGASKISFSGTQIPFPVEAELGLSAFNFVMPVSKSDTAQPAAMLIKLVDLKVSDALWDLVDANKNLPRDPATVIIDVSGALKPLVNIFDPEVTAEPSADGETPLAAVPSPFEVSEARINQLQIKAAGAELTGTGALTFDNSTGTPVPLGAIDLGLTGANKLMDSLVAMGLMPEDQVMGARMMLGMFAVPAGEDALTSKIEFKEGGAIFANGQQIQ